MIRVRCYLNASAKHINYIHADLIIVLDHGRIVEKSTHGELLKQGGLYVGLWGKQTHEKPVGAV